MTPDEVLERAAKVIEKPGVWVKGSMGRVTADGQLQNACAMGILCYTVTGTLRPTGWSSRHTGHPELDTALTALDEQPGVDGSIIAWNDDTAQSADEIATGMRDAAREWRIANPSA